MYNFTEQGKDLNQVINETERFLESLLEGKSLPVQKRYLTQTLKEEQELYNKMEKAQKSDGWLHGEIVQYSDVLIQKEIVYNLSEYSLGKISDYQNGTIERTLKVLAGLGLEQQRDRQHYRRQVAKAKYD